MLDAFLRPVINKPLEIIASYLNHKHITPNSITYTGFLFGIMAALCLMFHLYIIALALILINRLCDGLDGGVARISDTQSDYGGYLDIVLDFIFYSGIIFGFALGHQDQAIYGAFLIFSFMGTGSSFLAYAILAEKKKLVTTARGKKSFFHTGGLAEGTETIVTLVLICLLPQQFYLFALLFGMMCWLTTIGRILQTKEDFA